MVQWMDVNQLSQEENLHSKCLCVDRLPLDLCDSEELTQLFSETYKPVFCQVRYLKYVSVQLFILNHQVFTGHVSSAVYECPPSWTPPGERRWYKIQWSALPIGQPVGMITKQLFPWWGVAAVTPAPPFSFLPFARHCSPYAVTSAPPPHAHSMSICHLSAFPVLAPPLCPTPT